MTTVVTGINIIKTITPCEVTAPIYPAPSNTIAKNEEIIEAFGSGFAFTEPKIVS